MQFARFTQRPSQRHGRKPKIRQSLGGFLNVFLSVFRVERYTLTWSWCSRAAVHPGSSPGAPCSGRCSGASWLIRQRLMGQSAAAGTPLRGRESEAWWVRAHVCYSRWVQGKPHHFRLTPTLDIPHDDITAAVSRDQLITQRQQQAHFLFMTVVMHHHLYGEQTTGSFLFSARFYYLILLFNLNLSDHKEKNYSNRNKTDFLISYLNNI